MKMLRRLARLASGLACCLVAGHAMAANLSGVWVSNEMMCNKVFVKKGKSVTFARDADLFGSGFIIEGSKIRGKMATCTIKTQREDGDIVHMLASCSTDVMLSSVQLSVRVKNDNQIARLFPGMSEMMETDYYRCSM